VGSTGRRTKENLGVSDRGVIMMRKRFFDDLARIERGEDPSGLIRDPAKNVCIELPIADKEFLVNSLSLEKMLADPSVDPREFLAIAGLPKDVAREVFAAIGLEADGQPLGQDGAVSVLSEAGAGPKGAAWWLT
jgi:5,5'-dehydrodivanillate O-demethylase